MTRSSLLKRRSRLVQAATIAAVVALAIAGCSSSKKSGSSTTTGAAGSGSSSAVATGDPIKIGLIASFTGNFAQQAKDELNGVSAALDFLTKGSGIINGHKVTLLQGDDTGVPAVGTTVAKTLIGEGAQIIIGPTSSAVAVPVAQLCVQNKVLYIGGTSGTTDLVGMNDLVYAASGASPAGSLLTKALLGSNLSGKTLATVDQDYAYGQSSQAALKALLAPAGVKVVGYLLPQTTTDFSAVALQIKQLHPDFLTSGWAGAGQNQLWSTIGSQGLTKLSTVFASLLLRNSWAAIADALGTGLPDAVFTLGYYGGISNNAEDAALVAYSKAHNHVIEYDDAVGWNGAAMIFHAVTVGGTDTAAMAKSLKDYSFEGPAGTVTIRGTDNQVTVPSATVHLAKDSSGNYQPSVIKIYTAAELQPPVVKAIPS